MAGITQGQPEVAVGEPIRFGDIDGFELEQHPVSDRLVIRDTENGTVAYVRAERGGQIGGDGVLIKALKESKPMADTGRTYATIQEAERAATGWVFVPPGTYDEEIEINTQGLTLRGSGYNTHINYQDGNTILVNVDNVSVSDISISSSAAAIGRGTNGITGTTVKNCTVREATLGIRFDEAISPTVVNCTIESFTEWAGIAITDGVAVGNIIVGTDESNNNGISSQNDNVIANNIIREVGQTGIEVEDNSILVGNRIINSGDDGILVESENENMLIANNRISDSGGSDISDSGTGTLLDGNLTGGAN